MEPNSRGLNGHDHFDCGGVITTEHLTSQHYDSTGRKKSKVRLNDQLIPKPTDINMVEKMKNVSTPKEHPYSSHISQFAMFPSFQSPDDPLTGVRAAHQSFINPLISKRAPEVTLLSKTMGSPYRHEVVEANTKREKKALIWTGEHGFFDQKKQVLYPSPPKKVHPNPKLREWDLSLSEWTSNILKNLERSHWITSYQMHYTGSGPANPLQMDNLKDKLSDLNWMNSLPAPLRERSLPVFVPAKPRKVGRGRHGNTGSSSASEVLNAFSAPHQGCVSATVKQYRPRDIRAEPNEAPDPRPPECSQGALHKEQTERKSFAHEGRKRENCKVYFDESFTQTTSSLLPRSSREANAAWIAGTEHHLDRRPESKGEVEASKDESIKKQRVKVERHASSLSQPIVAKDMLGDESKEASEWEKPGKDKVLQCSTSNFPILQRPPVLPSIQPVDQIRTLGGEAGSLRLLELQNSFSKSMAHRNFSKCITYAAVNLRDNVVTGKKHDFYGINCNHLRGGLNGHTF